MKNNIPGPLKKYTMLNIAKLSYFLPFIFIIGWSCQERKKETKENVGTKPVATISKAPDFNEDSAYYYIQKQVAFGPRVPNSPAHVKCEEYLTGFLKSLTQDVTVQQFEARAFDGKQLRLKNIIASLYPEANKRILLAAHWDSRPFAEKDSINKNKPIDGANDGASGVGILLEVARSLKNNNNLKNVGVDIILFDGEDYGHSSGMPGNDGPDTWCLGSQYWAKNKHIQNYAAYYGILLDMVGAKGAKFAMEGTSMQFAAEINNRVWQVANQAGFGEFFIYKKSDAITDDHTYINEIAKIPMIDIIDFDVEKDSYFGWYHHTHNDNMSVIDKKTLNAVGQTLLEVLYQEQ